MCLACDGEQAKIVLDYSRSYFSDIELLRDWIMRETANGFALDNGVDVAISTEQLSQPCAAVPCCAPCSMSRLLASQDSASPDEEVYRAVTPGMATIPGSRADRHQLALQAKRPALAKV